MLRDMTYAEELEQLKTRDGDDDGPDGGPGGGDGSGQMSAFDMLKRVLQLKRLMGENAGGEGGAAGAAGGEGVEDELAGERVQAGCTAVVAVKQGNELYCANAGDSRGVLCRGGTAVALSEDHKPAAETERLRIINAGGYLSEIGACRGLSMGLMWVLGGVQRRRPAHRCSERSSGRGASHVCTATLRLAPLLPLAHPKPPKPSKNTPEKQKCAGGVCRVNGNLNLSRAIGDLKYKANSGLPAKDQIISAEPDIRHVTLCPDDRFFLLACDGVWDVMTNQARAGPP
jgi:hypothetical protein